MSFENREDIINEAKGYVTKDRNTSYGEPEDNFRAIADVWNAQGVRIDNGRGITPTDVALMMMGMKLARLKDNPMHRDSWADTIGYAACGWDTVTSPQKFLNAVNAMDVDKVNSMLQDEGTWVSHNNRCGVAKLHPGHNYSTGDKELGEIHETGLWCEGYVSTSGVEAATTDKDRKLFWNPRTRGPVPVKPLWNPRV
jgi:hypothetical protein